jgi:hypothetical protein
MRNIKLKTIGRQQLLCRGKALTRKPIANMKQTASARRNTTAVHASLNVSAAPVSNLTQCSRVAATAKIRMLKNDSCGPAMADLVGPSIKNRCGTVTNSSNMTNIFDCSPYKGPFGPYIKFWRDSRARKVLPTRFQKTFLHSLDEGKQQ